MAKINILILLIINLFISTEGFAQSNSNRVYAFLELPISPRSAALSVHLVSQTNPDIFSSLANPAYLDSSFHNSAQVAYYAHFSDVSISSIGYSYNLKNIGEITTLIRYMSYGDFKKIDENGFETGIFNSYDLAFTTSLARNLASNLQIGASFTLIRSVIDHYNSHGILFSVGTYYAIPSELITMGFAIRDFGSQIDSYNSQSEKAPFDISFGITKKFKYVPFRFTLTAHSLQDWPLKTIYDSKTPTFTTSLYRHLAFGGEFLFTDSFHLRFGLNKYKADAISTSQRLDFSGTSFGTGFKISRFLIDFSRTSYSSIGSHFQLSISTKF